MKRALSALVLVTAAGCATGRAAQQPGPQAQTQARPAVAYPSTYRPFPSTPTLLRGGTVMTATGQVIPNGQVLMVDGRIAAVGATVDAPANATVVDATGRWITPGVI
ncbi:MAG TPA: hypothetical protein VGB92_22275, partial [Longimicrobium sp.]